MIYLGKRLGINVKDMNQFYVHDFEPIFKVYTKWLEHIDDLRNTDKLLILSRNKNQQTGEEIPVEVTVRLTTFEGQEFVIAVSRDITERLTNEISKSKKSFPRNFNGNFFYLYKFSTWKF
jgi:hypothetical protein